MAIRTNLQAIRRRAGFKSAKEFAEHMGINPTTYTNYEQGKANMTLIQAWEFADELKCTLDELAGRMSPNAADALDNCERSIIDTYRDADRRGRRAIERAVEGVREDMEDEAREKKEVV